MTDKKHVHKLKKVKYKSGNATYFCTLPDCTYKINPSLALGKRAICWRCDEPFILTEYSLRLTKPHCANCHKPKDQKEVPWIHPPNETEKEAVKELVLMVKELETMSLAERLQREIEERKEDI